MNLLRIPEKIHLPNFQFIAFPEKVGTFRTAGEFLQRSAGAATAKETYPNAEITCNIRTLSIQALAETDQAT
jgi:hypothetical protein